MICDLAGSARQFKPLVAEKGKLSLGRVAFWTLFTVALYHYPALSSEWVTVMMALLAYNGYSKNSKTHDP